METKEAIRIWTAACGHLKQILQEDAYERWIAVISCKSAGDQQIHLSVANDFYLSWLEENYLPLIQTAITTITGKEYEVFLTVDQDIAGTSPPPVPLDKTTGSRRLSLKKEKDPFKESGLNPSYTFDNFIIGPSNNFAHAAAVAVSQSPSKAYNPLFIHGGTGLGKTHLMQAIGNHIVTKSKNKKVCYVSCENFVNEYIEALREKKLTDFRRQYRNMDILLMDDIHFLINKLQMQEEFFHTFNALFHNHKQIIITCDRPAGELSGMTDRLVSRFEWGLTTEIEIPDVETRTAILQKKSQDLNMQVPPDLIHFLAERISSNIRRLEGSLIRVASYLSLTGRELDTSGLEYLLRDTLDEQAANEITIEMIQRIVADHFDIRVTDIMSKKRPASIAWPRQVAMYLSRELTPRSFPSIGESFNRNHATILHAHSTVSKKLQLDSTLRQTIGLLQRKIVKKPLHIC